MTQTIIYFCIFLLWAHCQAVFGQSASGQCSLLGTWKLEVRVDEATKSTFNSWEYSFGADQTFTTNLLSVITYRLDRNTSCASLARETGTWSLDTNVTNPLPLTFAVQSCTGSTNGTQPDCKLWNSNTLWYLCANGEARTVSFPRPDFGQPLDCTKMIFKGVSFVRQDANSASSSNSSLSTDSSTRTALIITLVFLIILGLVLMSILWALIVHYRNRNIARHTQMQVTSVAS